MIKKELDHFRADENEKIIPGHHEAILYKGKSILRRLISSGIVNRLQAIHNRENVKKMRGSWLKSFSVGHIIQQPLDELDKYFGLEMGLYFNFVQHYGIGLFVLAMFILILIMLGQGQSSLISVITIVWSFVWLYSWRGAEAKRSYENGSLNTIGRGWEEARPEYFGPLSKNEITGEDEPSYPSSKYYIRCSLSYFICAICCYAAYLLMLVYYSWEKWTYDKYGIDSWVAMVPGIMYTVLVVISSQQYRRLAKSLTNFENHRTEHQYQSNLLIKLLVFEFINNFLVMYFLAFIYQDIQMLRSTVITTMTVSQVFVEIFEGFVPFLMYRKRTKNQSKKFESLSDQMKYEKLRDEYEGNFDEFLELWIQFGYVTLFTCIYEWAPVCALIATLIEIRNDAHKFCNLLQRPIPSIAENIGYWDNAFSLLAFLSIPTSVAMAVMSGATTWTQAVLVEHVVVFIMIFFNRVRPIPMETQKCIDKDEFYKLQQKRSQILQKANNEKLD